MLPTKHDQLEGYKDSEKMEEEEGIDLEQGRVPPSRTRGSQKKIGQ
jgi:hypothetical protein